MNSLYPLLALVLLAAAAAGTCTDNGAGAAPPLSVTLEALPGAVAGGPVMLRFVLTNTGERPLSVLTWHTPLEGLLSPCLEVRREGETVPYVGPMVKRGDPDAEEWVRLAPGAGAAADVDLARGWEMDVPGSYEVTFAGRLLDVAPEGAELPRPRGGLAPRHLAPATVQIDIVAP